MTKRRSSNPYDQFFKAPTAKYPRPKRGPSVNTMMKGLTRKPRKTSSRRSSPQQPIHHSPLYNFLGMLALVIVLAIVGMIVLSGLQPSPPKDHFPAPDTPAYTATYQSPSYSNGPSQNSDAYNGATALCKNGSLSYAKDHRGACSHNGGVAEWYK